MDLFLVFGSLLAVSLLAASGALLLFAGRERFENAVIYLVSLSTGAIFGGTFIHLVPKYAQNIGFTHLTGLLVIGGVAGSHLLEKAVHWHCHHSGTEVEPFSYMILVGDSLHNLIDGLIIASSYLISASSGLAATIAVALHKVPKEVGDFGTLVHGGFTKKKALAFNIAVGVFMFAGAGIVLLFSTSGAAELFILPFAIGNFVYIAGTDLLPEIKETEEDVSDLLVFGSFLLGVAMIYSIVFI